MPHLTLFGSLAIAFDGRPVARLESDKGRGLLARPALEPQRAFGREPSSASDCTSRRWRA